MNFSFKKNLTTVLSLLITTSAIASGSYTELNQNMSLNLDNGKLSVTNRYLTYNIIRGYDPKTGTIGGFKIISPNKQVLDWDTAIDWQWDGIFLDIPATAKSAKLPDLKEETTEIKNFKTAILPSGTDWKNSELRIHSGSFSGLFSKTNSSAEKIDRAGLVALNSLRFLEILSEAAAGEDALNKVTGGKSSGELFESMREIAKYANNGKEILDKTKILLAIADVWVEEVELYAQAVGVDPNSDPAFSAFYKNFKTFQEFYNQIAKINKYAINIDKEKKKLKGKLADQYKKVTGKESSKAANLLFKEFAEEFSVKYKSKKTTEEKKQLFLNHVVKNTNIAVFKFRADYLKSFKDKKERESARRNLNYAQAALTIAYLLTGGEDIAKKIQKDPKLILDVLTNVSKGAISKAMTLDNTDIAVRRYYQYLGDIDGRNAQMHQVRTVFKGAKKLGKAIDLADTIGNKLIPFMWDMGLAPNYLETSIVNGQLTTYGQLKPIVKIYYLNEKNQKRELLTTVTNFDKPIRVYPETSMSIAVGLDRPKLFGQTAPWKVQTFFVPRQLATVNIKESGKASAYAESALCLRKLKFKSEFAVHNIAYDGFSVSAKPTAADGSNSLYHACGQGTFYGKPWFKKPLKEYEIPLKYKTLGKIDRLENFAAMSYKPTGDSFKPVSITVGGFDALPKTYTLKFEKNTDIRVDGLEVTPNVIAGQNFEVRVTGVNLPIVEDFDMSGCLNKKLKINNSTKHIYECTAPSGNFSVKVLKFNSKEAYISKNVTLYQPLVFKFPETATVGKPYDYSISKSAGDSACYKSFILNWGDGKDDTGKVIGSTDCLVLSGLPKHSYAKAGTYNAMFSLIDSNGKRINRPQSVTVKTAPKIVWKTNPANGNQYTALDCGTWTQCQAKAVELGGNLVTIRNAKENQWLVDNFDSNKNYWIGLTDKDYEGTWKWTSGESLRYTNWITGEPSDGGDGSGGIKENYVHMNFNYPNRENIIGKWNDVQNDITVKDGVGGIPYNSSAMGLIEKTSNKSLSKLTATGITTCGNATKNNLPCTKAALGDYYGLGQDGEVQAGQKMSYTKLTRNGETCVKDNVTGLIWEQKTDDGGLRDKDNTYTWYNPDSKTNGGNSGTQNGGSCSGSACDTHAYVQALNKANYCGYSDWKVPTRNQLRNITNYSGAKVAINTIFKNTQALENNSYYWSSSLFAGKQDSAWAIRFFDGGDNNYHIHFGKNKKYHMRAVR